MDMVVGGSKSGGTIFLSGTEVDPGTREPAGTRVRFAIYLIVRGPGFATRSAADLATKSSAASKLAPLPVGWTDSRRTNSATITDK